MRALLIVDRLFAMHEREMLQRTAIGLLDEGVETTLILPGQEEANLSHISDLVPQIHYKDRGLSFTMRIRAMNILRELTTTKSSKSKAPTYDIVHAFGGQSWTLAHELAQSLNASLVIELWRTGLINKATTLHRSSSNDTMFTTPDQSIERIVRAQSPNLPVQLAPWGVSSPSTPREPSRSETRSLIFYSSGRNKDECAAAFDGTLDALKDNPNTHLFVNLNAARRASLWSRAKRADLLSQLTLIDQIEEQRDLVMNADMLIYPDSVLEQRSFLYEAMSNTMCVITSNDQLSSCIIPDKTAAIAPAPSAEHWSSTLRALFENPEHSSTIAKNAWQHIRDHRKASSHIGAILDVYTQLTATPV